MRSERKLGGTKIDLAFWEVDFKDGDAEVSACAVDLAGATAEEGATSGVEGEKITGKSGDVDEA